MGYTNFPLLNARILAALQTGADFTANQLRSRFGIEAVSARISELRNAGYSIYLNNKTTPNGRTIKTYRLGSPKRSTVVSGLVAERLMADGSLYIGMDTFRRNVNDALSLVQ